jgi:NAD(P)H-dependent FMN reductase
MDNGQGESMIQIAALCGSLRAGSYSRMALQIALQGAEEVGAQTRLLDLRQYDLPHCDARKNARYPDDVLNLREAVQSAHGIILGTPVYHGSFSGVLKNALDLMGFAEFEGKMMGLVGVSGGRTGAVNTLDSLRAIGRVLHAWVVPEQVSIPEAWKAFDSEGNIKDVELDRRLREVGRQVARYAYLHSSEQALEFLRLWESAPVNPGAERRQDASVG